MKRLAETIPASIDTVPRAAEELVRLYHGLGRQAIELTNDYLTARLTGEEGVTWWRTAGIISKRIPILDSVMRASGSLELGGEYNVFNDHPVHYRLTEEKTADDTTSILVHREGRAFDAGEKYRVLADQVLRAGYTSWQATALRQEDMQGTVSAIDTNHYYPVTTEDATTFKKLTRVIASIRSYEIPSTGSETVLSRATVL
jgi:hypothetical protein